MLAIIFVLVIVLAPVCAALIGYALYYLMMQVIAGRMTLGDIVLLAGYGSMLANPMAIIGSTWASVQASVAGLRRVHSVLDNLAEPVGDGAATDSTARIGSLEFSGVAIGYGAATVLNDVTMSMRAGEMVALAGPSGCGKTTLIHSIPRFIEPSAGTIAFDGVDSRAVAPDSIRARVGFVFQNESLFSISIEDNIRYGSDGASKADVREAAAMAGAAEFIDRLPDGYSTMLGRRGARLSVGQKQRIAIARALLRRPEIIVLDEPAAPLDPASESELMKTLTRARARSNRHHRRPSPRHARRLRPRLLHPRRHDCGLRHACASARNQPRLPGLPRADRCRNSRLILARRLLFK